MPGFLRRSLRIKLPIAGGLVLLLGSGLVRFSPDTTARTGTDILWISATALSVLLVAAGATLFIRARAGRKVNGPLREVARTLAMRDAGDLSARVKRSSGDEIGRLGQILNAPLDRIDAAGRELRTRESELHTSFDELLAIQQAIDHHVSVVITDQAGNILHMNRLFMELTGYLAGELMGADISKLGSGAHPTRLRQILVNLVGNAVKFTHVGKVIVRASAVTAEDRAIAVRFEVSDTGIGVPAEQHALVFDAFAQGDTTTTRQYGGTGLGLSISTRLARLMGGEISVSSQPGHGSTFAFDLRFDATAKGAMSIAAPAGLLGRDVVMSGGSESGLRARRRWLEHWGARIHRDPDEPALDRLLAAARVPVLWIMDCGLADLEDGRSLPALLRDRSEAIRLISLYAPRAGSGTALPRGSIALLNPAGPLELAAAIETALRTGAPPVTAPPTSRSMLHQASKLHVLLVEDNPINCKVASALLRRLGHEVSVATNGEDALSAIAARRPDVVLMDVQMPVMGGFEATTRLRVIEQATGAARLPVIALTAAALAVDRAQCFASGMDDYLTKPIEFEVLRAALERVPIARPTPEGLAHANAPGAAVGPVFNPEVALMLVAEDAGLLAEVIDVSLEELPRQVEALRQAIGHRDAPTAQRLAHTLKGTAGTLGATQLHQAAYAVEHAAEDADMARAGDELGGLRSLVIRLCSELDAYRAPTVIGS